MGRKKRDRGSYVETASGEVCGHCRHGLIWRERTSRPHQRRDQRSYFTKWLYCAGCGATRHFEKYKVRFASTPAKKKNKQKRPGLSMHARAKREYRDRGLTLKALGYPDYEAYLDSPVWRVIRAKVLDADSECYGCGKYATSVHHGKYSVAVLSIEVLKRGWSDVLFPICRKCHEHIEYTRSGRKNSPTDATRKLKAMHKRLLRECRKAESERKVELEALFA